MNERSDILKEKEKFYAEKDLSPDVKKILDEVFAEMIIEDVKSDLSVINDKVKTEPSPTIEMISKHETELPNKQIPPPYEEKVEELEKKIEQYNERIKELEEKRIEYEARVKEFEERSYALEEIKKEFQKKNQKLEESRGDLEKHSNKLEKARQQFIQLSKQVEEKKIELQKRESNIIKSQRTLEKQRYQYEKNRIELEKKELKLEEGKTELKLKSKEFNSINYDKEEERLEIEDKTEMEKGKVEILQDILQELLYHGMFKSCFLIDGKGMIISEYSETELDSLAIGAMFSLISTTVLRTVKSLNLTALEYFKLSSVNGEFLLRNIDIRNYERNFILLAYYDDEPIALTKNNRKLSKKTIKKILKNVKEDFYEFRKGLKISWVFDNLAEKIDFLKQKYSNFEGDIELMRINLLNKTSIKIIELFEM